MKCHEYEADLVDLARIDATIGQHGSEFRKHLDTCADCAARFERERQLSAGLRALAREVEVVEANPVAERRLIEMFESRRAAQGGQGVFSSVRPTNWMWALAAAAGLVLFVGATWSAVRWDRASGSVGSQASPGGVHGAMPPADGRRLAGSAAQRVDTPPGDAGVRALSSTARAETGRVLTSRTTSRRTTSRGNRSPAVEEFDGFMALPAADRLPEFESGMIVRVELPVASLPAYGLEIVPDVARTPVKADVLVGQDGQPRAIRLVSMETRPRRIR